MPGREGGQGGLLDPNEPTEKERGQERLGTNPFHSRSLESQEGREPLWVFTELGLLTVGTGGLEG